MRQKKPPLSPTATPPQPSTETDQQVTVRSIVTMTQILMQCLQPEFTVTPGQLCDLCEMYLAVMHMKKVTDRWYTEHLPNVSSMMQLAKQIEAEYSLSQTEGLSETGVKTMKEAMELSLKEINTLRAKLLKDVELLRQIPLPGTTIH